MRAVLLDVDGTLVDSNEAHAQAWSAALREHGYAVSPARVRPYIGMGGDKLLPKLTGLTPESPRGRPIADRRRDIFLERCLPLVRAFPCTRDFVCRLHEQGVEVAVASSAKSEELRALLSRACVDDLIGEAASPSDDVRSKPDPDVVRAALARLRLPPDHALMIGDTPYDIEAAARVGVPTIALRCGGWSGSALSNAVAIYDDLRDVLAQWEDSPLGRRAA